MTNLSKYVAKLEFIILEASLVLYLNLPCQKKDMGTLLQENNQQHSVMRPDVKQQCYYFPLMITFFYKNFQTSEG